MENPGSCRSHTFLPAFNLTGMLLRLLVVVDAHEKDVARIFSDL